MMPYWLLDGTIPIPYTGDRVIITKRGHIARGRAGLIVSSKEGQVFAYDAEDIHTVRLDSGETIVVNDQEVRFETKPKPKVKVKKQRP